MEGGWNLLQHNLKIILGYLFVILLITAIYLTIFIVTYEQKNKATCEKFGLITELQVGDEFAWCSNNSYVCNNCNKVISQKQRRFDIALNKKIKEDLNKWLNMSVYQKKNKE